MSYQTEEVLPMLDGVMTTKKQSFGLAAFMVLCLSVSSFMAGHYYGSAATASGFSSSYSCDMERHHLKTVCPSDVYYCLLPIMFFGAPGSESACMAGVVETHCLNSFDTMQGICHTTGS